MGYTLRESYNIFSIKIAEEYKNNLTQIKVLFLADMVALKRAVWFYEMLRKIAKLVPHGCDGPAGYLWA